MRHNAFVYGTLKSGQYNNKRLGRSAKLIGRAVSVDADYHMHSNGYPQVWKAPDGRQIVGEVWSITDKGLADCDLLEGHPHFYQREERQFDVKGDGVFVAERMTAWVYLIPAPPEGRVPPPPADLINEQDMLEWRPI